MPVNTFIGNDGQNYSSNFYRINDWYKAWLPDDAHIKQLHDTKTVYDVRIRYANNTNATYSFHGPRGKPSFQMNIHKKYYNLQYDRKIY